MPRADNAYSQFVALTKIVLPIVGLGLLSSLFLLSDQERDVGELPYSEVELEEIAENQSISGPVYQTTLDNGSSVRLRARTARPILTDPGTYKAVDLTGVMTTLSGDEITLDGGLAHVDQNARTATVEDGLRIVHSNGFVLTAQSGTSSFDGTRATSEGNVIVEGDNIKISAARAEFQQNPEKQSQVVVFSGGVTVLYTPQ